jgi:hypothetical protein
MQFITQLRDPEFHQALTRAKEQGYSQIDYARNYPFMPIKRAEAAIWFVETAKILQQSCLTQQQDIPACQIKDIQDISTTGQTLIKQACACNYLKGNNGSFEPESYLNKASSIVALLRGRLGEEQFQIQTGQKYRDPYVSYAYDMNITKSPHIEYLQYLVTNYELVMMLWRARDVQSN